MTHASRLKNSMKKVQWDELHARTYLDIRGWLDLTTGYSHVPGQPGQETW